MRFYRFDDAGEMTRPHISAFALLVVLALVACTGCANEHAGVPAPAAAQPTAAPPAVTEPVAPGPVTSPAAAQPTAAQAGVTEPVAPGPVTSPAAAQPSTAQPTASVETDGRVYRGGGESWVKWLPELLNNSPKCPTWTAYNLGDHVTFRGPPGLWTKTYESERELRGDFGNADFVASISYGVGVRGNVPAAQQNTTMGGLPAAIGKVPGFRDLWAQTIGRPGEPDVSVRVKFAIKRKWVSRSVVQEVVDLVRSIKMSPSGAAP